MTFTIDNIITEQIVDYITTHDFIKDNFNNIKEIVETYTNYTPKDAIIDFMEENYENIVNPLYNMTEGFLSYNEYREVISDGEELWGIMRVVYLYCRDTDSLNTYEEHIRYDNKSKIIDLYMYFKAKEILNDLRDYEEEILDKLVELYEEEEVEINKIYNTKRNIAISKIKRNRIYNTGLGLRLAVKAFCKDF
jgi:hypothetical protein